MSKDTVFTLILISFIISGCILPLDKIPQPIAKTQYFPPIFEVNGSLKFDTIEVMEGDAQGEKLSDIKFLWVVKTSLSKKTKHFQFTYGEIPDGFECVIPPKQTAKSTAECENYLLEHPLRNRHNFFYASTLVPLEKVQNYVILVSCNSNIIGSFMLNKFPILKVEQAHLTFEIARKGSVVNTIKISRLAGKTKKILWLIKSEQPISTEKLIFTYGKEPQGFHRIFPLLSDEVEPLSNKHGYIVESYYTRDKDISPIEVFEYVAPTTNSGDDENNK